MPLHKTTLMVCHLGPFSGQIPLHKTNLVVCHLVRLCAQRDLLTSYWHSNAKHNTQGFLEE